MTSTARSRLTKARTDLILLHPYHGYLALHLPLKEDPTCKTAWVDGRNLGYNPAFIDTLTHAQVMALVAHEVEHVARGHVWRRDGRDLKDWNIACDKTINSDVKASGFTLPDGAYYAEGDEAGKSAEWIFARIHTSSKPQQQGQAKPNASGNGPAGQQGQGQGEPDPLGELRDAPTTPDPDGTPAPSEQEWKQKTASALIQAKLAGKLPGGMERNIQQALKPRLDVRSLLLRFFSERAAGDYSWTKPSTRYIPQGLYLPSLQSKTLGRVAIMVDTSGSVDEESLGYARGIVEAVIDECQPAGVDVFYADAKVKRIDRFEKGEPLTWKPEGGGGTNFIPALEAIDAEGEAVCILCITDLYGRFPDNPPDLPVLWLATTDVIAPFGETIPLDR